MAAAHSGLHNFHSPSTRFILRVMVGLGGRVSGIGCQRECAYAVRICASVCADPARPRTGHPVGCHRAAAGGGWNGGRCLGDGGGHGPGVVMS